MSKTVKDIKWILSPIWLSCTVCNTAQSTKEAIIDEAYHFVLCEPCSQLSEHELKDKLFKRKAVK